MFCCPDALGNSDAELPYVACQAGAGQLVPNAPETRSAPPRGGLTQGVVRHDGKRQLQVGADAVGGGVGPSRLVEVVVVGAFAIVGVACVGLHGGDRGAQPDRRQHPYQAAPQRWGVPPMGEVNGWRPPGGQRVSMDSGSETRSALTGRHPSDRMAGRTRSVI